MKKIVQIIAVVTLAFNANLLFAQTVQDSSYNDRKPAGANNGRQVDPQNGTNLNPQNGTTTRPENSVGATDTVTTVKNRATGNTKITGGTPKKKSVSKGRKK